MIEPIILTTQKEKKKTETVPRDRVYKTKTMR